MSGVRLGYVFVVLILFVGLFTLFQIEIVPLRDKIKELGKSKIRNI